MNQNVSATPKYALKRSNK